MRKPFSLIASLVLVACIFAAPAPAAPNAAEAVVRNAVLGFQTTWNHHDMVAFGKLFALDADFVTVSTAWMKGRETIQRSHAWLHGAIPRDTPGFPKSAGPQYGLFKHTTMRFIHIDVRFLRSDVAIARVNWELFGDPRTPTRRGLLTFVLTRQNGGWLIAAGQNTEADTLRSAH